MSETIDPSEMTELDSLKQLATNMNIPYSPNIGIETLQARIDEAKAAITPVVAVATTRVENKLEASKLIRVTVLCMDPGLKGHVGSWITASNAVVGTLKRFVPFDQETHIENFIFKVMRDKVYRKTIEVPDGKGGKYKVNRFVPAYNIAVLPALTPAELKELAISQAQRGALE